MGLWGRRMQVSIFCPSPERVIWSSRSGLFWFSAIQRAVRLGRVVTENGRNCSLYTGKEMN